VLSLTRPSSGAEVPQEGQAMGQGSHGAREKLRLGIAWGRLWG